jgi:hypothetical protein
VVQGAAARRPIRHARHAGIRVGATLQLPNSVHAAAVAVTLAIRGGQRVIEVHRDLTGEAGRHERLKIVAELVGKVRVAAARARIPPSHLATAGQTVQTCFAQRRREHCRHRNAAGPSGNLKVDGTPTEMASGENGRDARTRAVRGSRLVHQHVPETVFCCVRDAQARLDLCARMVHGAARGRWATGLRVGNRFRTALSGDTRAYTCTNQHARG